MRYMQIQLSDIENAQLSEEEKRMLKESTMSTAEKKFINNAASRYYFSSEIVNIDKLMEVAGLSDFIENSDSGDAFEEKMKESACAKIIGIAEGFYDLHIVTDNSGRHGCCHIVSENAVIAYLLEYYYPFLQSRKFSVTVPHISDDGKAETQVIDRFFIQRISFPYTEDGEKKSFDVENIPVSLFFLGDVEYLEYFIRAQISSLTKEQIKEILNSSTWLELKRELSKRAA